MERNKASDYPQELLDLFDLYVHGELDRRGFIERAKEVRNRRLSRPWRCGRVCAPNYAWAEQVPKTISRLKTEYADRAIAAGERQHPRLFCPSGQGFRQAFGRACRPRESRIESLHRRRCATSRDGKLHGVRSRRVDQRGRISR